MAGRPAKPIQLHTANGNKRHLTKAEIAAREQQEKALRSGQKVCKPSPQVKADLVAHAMFKKLAKLYKTIDYVEALDENVINRYCLLHADHVRLTEMRHQLQVMLQKEENDAAKLSLMDRIVALDRRLDKRIAQMLQLEDRLFLTPTSRIRNVPKQEPKEEQDPNAHLFG